MLFLTRVPGDGRRRGGIRLLSAMSYHNLCLAVAVRLDVPWFSSCIKASALIELEYVSVASWSIFPEMRAPSLLLVRLLSYLTCLRSILIVYRLFEDKTLSWVLFEFRADHHARAPYHAG